MNSKRREWETETFRGGDVGFRSIPPDALVCFTVDPYPIPDYERIRCDNKLDEPPELGFDYIHDLKKFRSDMEAEFLSVILQHIEERPFSSDPIGLQDISKHFEPAKYLRQRFGLLDTSSKEYRNLLEGFQEGLEEELKEILSDLNNFLERRSWRNVQQQLEDIKLYYKPSSTGFLTSKDPRNSQSSHSLRSSFDAYKLPRVTTEDIPEYLDVDQSKKGLLSKEVVNDPLVCEAMRILLNNPLGICPKRLKSELMGTHQSKFNIREFLKLSEDTCIPVEEIPRRLNSTFGIRLSPDAWGNDSELEFLKKLLRDYDVNDEVEIFEESSLRLVVLPEPDPINVFLEELGFEDIKTTASSVVVKRAVEVLPEFSEFLSANVEIRSVAGSIKKGTTYFVLPDFMRTPVEFYVSLAQNWEMRNEFIKEMTIKYEKWNSDPDLSAKITVLPDFIKKNCHVVVKSQNEWVRGKILGHYEGKYTVYLIDLGYEIEGVSTSEMKYLHRDFVSDNFPAQAFPCAFRRKLLRETFPGLEGLGSIKFPEETLEKFYTLLQFHTFGIRTLARVEHSGFWVVDGFLVDNVEDRNILVADVVSELIGRHSLQWKKKRNFLKSNLSRKRKN
ncbi:unnamed protein product [Allacma fusca]|uniref:Tudor domain-containing protein n=1 Tax=Allacma fusca TaxID=39272 RepID=A0A8J2JV88_9HEXA|nr:unnamed protein product [Allacma fusca]